MYSSYLYEACNRYLGHMILIKVFPNMGQAFTILPLIRSPGQQKISRKRINRYF